MGISNFILPIIKQLLAMLYVTFWPITIGFIFDGLIHEFLPTEKMVKHLGKANLSSSLKALGLGASSSSCSYAATALTKSLIQKGTNFTTSMIFMFASTNLVIEVFLLMIALMGYKFALAEILGAIIMAIVLYLTSPVILTTTTLNEIRLHLSTAEKELDSTQDTAENPTFLSRVAKGFGFGISELNMIKKELFAGYIIGSVIAAKVPVSFWNILFLKHFGILGAILDAFIGPLVAMISFLCSEANIPVAWALFTSKVNFGAVVSFIFGDLLIIPLLLIYKRYFGPKVALKLAIWFWFTMSIAGLVTEAIFNLLHSTPQPIAYKFATATHLSSINFYLDIVSLLILVTLTVFYIITKDTNTSVAIDPICKMQVKKASPGATAEINGKKYYFCSDHCKMKFQATK